MWVIMGIEFPKWGAIAIFSVLFLQCLGILFRPAEPKPDEDETSD